MTAQPDAAIVHRGGRWPQGPRVIVSRGSFGPDGLRLLEASIGEFSAAGFAVDEAADAYFAVSVFVIGFYLSET